MYKACRIVMSGDLDIRSDGPVTEEGTLALHKHSRFSLEEMPLAASTKPLLACKNWNLPVDSELLSYRYLDKCRLHVEGAKNPCPHTGSLLGSELGTAFNLLTSHHILFHISTFKPEDSNSELSHILTRRLVTRSRLSWFCRNNLAVYFPTKLDSPVCGYHLLFGSIASIVVSYLPFS